MLRASSGSFATVSAPAWAGISMGRARSAELPVPCQPAPARKPRPSRLHARIDASATATASRPATSTSQQVRLLEPVGPQWQELQTEQQFQEAVLNCSDDELCVVDYYGTWCGPCAMIGSELNNIASDAALKKKCKFFKVNVENPNLRELALREGVRSLPFISMYRANDGLIAAFPTSPAKMKFIRKNVVTVLRNHKYAKQFITDARGVIQTVLREDALPKVQALARVGQEQQLVMA